MLAPVTTGISSSNGNGTNSVNSVSTAIWTSNSINVHYQTAFALNAAPSISYGTSSTSLTNNVTGTTKNYGYQCSLLNYTVCSAYYHDIVLPNLQSNAYYYYRINNDTSGINGTQIYTVKSPIAPGYVIGTCSILLHM